MSGTAVAISTMAAVNAANAAAAANRAEEAAHQTQVLYCQGFIQNFDAHGASVPAMRQYRDCVALVYPDPEPDALNTPVGKVGIGLLMLLVIIGMVIGFCRAWDDGVAEKIFFPFIGGIVGLGIWVLGLLFTAGIMFLFS